MRAVKNYTPNMMDDLSSSIQVNHSNFDLSSNIAVATSLDFAERFNKRHDNVMSDIRLIISKLGTEISLLKFQESDYTNERGKKYPCYAITPSGLLLLSGYYDVTVQSSVLDWVSDLQKQVNYLTNANDSVPLRFEKDFVRDFPKGNDGGYCTNAYNILYDKGGLEAISNLFHYCASLTLTQNPRKIYMDEIMIVVFNQFLDAKIRKYGYKIVSGKDHIILEMKLVLSNSRDGSYIRSLSQQKSYLAQQVKDAKVEIGLLEDEVSNIKPKVFKCDIKRNPSFPDRAAGLNDDMEFYIGKRKAQHGGTYMSGFVRIFDLGVVIDIAGAVGSTSFISKPRGEEKYSADLILKDGVAICTINTRRSY
jgi:Rha family phage regulatory protein